MRSIKEAVALPVEVAVHHPAEAVVVLPLVVAVAHFPVATVRCPAVADHQVEVAPVHRPVAAVDRSPAHHC
jgi:hypothetical protein